MNCDRIFKDPLLAAVLGSLLTMLYFVLTTYFKALMPALICSLAVGYFIYVMLGGKKICDEQKPAVSTATVPVSPVSPVSPTVPVIPATVPATAPTSTALTTGQTVRTYQGF